MLIIRYLAIIAFLLQANSSLMAAPYLYSANSNDTVSVVDLVSNGLTATIQLPSNSIPSKICLNPLTPTAYILNSGSNTISVIDTSTNTLATTISDDRFTGLLALACSPDGKRVYVTNNNSNINKNYLFIIDATNNSVLTDGVLVGNNPDEMALNNDGSKAYVLNSSDATLSTIDTTTKTVNTISFNYADTQLGLAMHTNDKYLYILNTYLNTNDNFDGTIEIREPNSINILKQQIYTDSFPYRVKVNHATNLLYIFDYIGLRSVDPETRAVSTLVTSNGVFWEMELNSDATKLYVATDGLDTLKAYSTQNFTVPPETITLPVGSDPNSLATLHGMRHQLTTIASGSGTGIVAWPLKLTYPDANTRSIMVPDNQSVSINTEASQHSIINWTGCDSVTGNGTSNAVCTVNPLISDKTVRADFISIATMISPTMPFIFTGTTQAFTWNNAGADSYQLWIGTAAGKFDLGVYSTTTTSANATGLPANGSTVYVALHSRLGTTWYTSSYTYIASGAPAAAVINSPVGGSALAGTTQTFTWNNAGANSYQLWIGTAAGKFDLGVYSTTGTTANATGLPANGSTVYVQLNSRFGTTWLKNNYSYISGPP